MKKRSENCNGYCNWLTDKCYCGEVCWNCEKKNSPAVDTRGRCFKCGISFTATHRPEGLPKRFG